jgi:two-component system, NtrC family, sensor histidine kinase PilS
LSALLRRKSARLDAASSDLASQSLARAAATFTDEANDLRRRFAWWAILRTLVLSAALGASIWVESDKDGSAALWLLAAVVALTYGCNIGYGIALRRRVAPERIARVQVVLDLSITSVLVYLTGGAQSPYVLLYALSVVAAGAVRYRRGAVQSAIAAILAFTIISLIAWAHLLNLPTTGALQPWVQTTSAFFRSVSLNWLLLVGAGALGYIFADQLQRAAVSLQSERKAVGELYSLHQDIVQSLSSGLVTIDGNGNVLTMNDSAAEILQQDLSGAVSKTIDEILPGLSAKWQSDPTKELRRADLQIIAAGIERTVGISVSHLRDAENNNVGKVINFQDLTDLRRMERHVQRAERLATVGQLAAGVAHEIRNPLAAISGSIELLRQVPQTSEDDRSLMDIVTREIERLNTLIGDLLDYANPRPLQIIEFDIGILLAETIAVAQQDKGRTGVDMELSCDTSIRVLGDADKIRQVVWNLIRNAHDASPNQGTIRVEARTKGSDVEISISDQGAGMTGEQASRVFDPFFTTKKKGTGLGLATCHAIVADHGGRIDVDTVLGRGTTMTVVLTNALAPSQNLKSEKNNAH